MSRAAVAVLGGAMLALAGVAMARTARAAPAGVGTDDDAESAQVGALDELLLPVYQLEDAIMGGMRLSPAGLAELADIEAFVPVPYRDQAGILTIGYGHRILPGESFGSITRDEALELLGRDVAIAERAVNSLVTVMLAQSQFDALVSFVFNIGAAAFRKSTLLKRLNAGELWAVPDEMRRWNKITLDGLKVRSAGLVNRREREVAQWEEA